LQMSLNWSYHAMVSEKKTFPLKSTDIESIPSSREYNVTAINVHI
jgi:hypothetical protein